MSMLSRLTHHIRRRWFYGLISTLVAFGLILGTALPAPAVSVFDLLFRSLPSVIQVVQLSSLSDRQEVALGGQINNQLVRQRIRLYRDAGINQYVDEIGQQMARNSTRPGIPYTFQVVQDDSINAFATMGGYVYITTGLMKAADNEAQLASVVGHEIAHIAARHSVQQMRQRALASGVARATGLDRNTAVNIGVELAINRPNSRQDEFEADRLGLETMRNTGYAPIATIEFMQKLLRRSGMPTFLSTHPATNDRITALQQMIDSDTATVGAGLDNTAYRDRIQRLL